MFVFVIIKEPENDRFEEVIAEMRRNLNWVAELPRHGQGVLEKMDNINDDVDVSKDLEVP